MNKSEAIVHMINGKKIRRSAWIYNPYLYIYFNRVAGKFKYPPQKGEDADVTNADCVEINDFPNYVNDYEIYEEDNYK